MRVLLACVDSVVFQFSISDQTDDRPTPDETEVSATARVWLILCASLVCMLFSSKLDNTVKP